MKYSMHQQWFSLADGCPIVDEKGRQAFHMGGAAFAFGEKLSIRDRRDDELAYVTQKLLAWGPTYEIYHGDDLQAVVRRDRFVPGTVQFSADGGWPDDLHAEGNLLGREYTFTREGKPVGRVSKAFFGPAGTYGVEVGRGEDEVILLAGAVVIDLCCHDAGRIVPAAGTPSPVAVGVRRTG